MVFARSRLAATAVFIHVIQLAIFALRNLLAIFALGGAAAICGSRMTAGLRAADRLERALASVVLGLGTFATLIFPLGILGLLYPAVVLSVTGVIVAACALPAIPSVVASWPQVSSKLLRPAVIAIALALAPIVLLALYPPIGFDATLYHLPYAKLFVASHRLMFAAQLRYPVFPQLNELLFTAMLMFTGDVDAQLVQTLAAILTAAILVAWGRRSNLPYAGWIAAALWLGNPIVVYLATSAYIECGLALFFTAALWASERWRETDDPGWLLCAAGFAGFAAACKYPGMLAIFFVLALSLRRPMRAGLRTFSITLVVALLVMFPWYVRIWWLTGNPVFPFLVRWFGDNRWMFPHPALPADLARLSGLPWLLEPLVRGLVAPAIVGSNLLMHREIFGDLPPISPVYLLSLPALALVPFLRRQATVLVAAVMILTAMSLAGRAPSPHYLVCILPIWSLVVGYGWMLAVDAIFRHRAQFRSPSIVALGLLFFVPGPSYAGYRRVKLGPVPATQSEREAFLARQLPVYPALRFLNQSRGDNYTVYALHAENMTYFARGKFIGDWNGPGSFPRVLQGLDSSCVLFSRLRLLDVDYLIIPNAKLWAEVPQDSCFQKCFTSVFADSGATVFALAARCGS